MNCILPGSDLSAAGPAYLSQRVLLRPEQDIHPVAGCRRPARGVEERQTGGACNSHTKDLERVAREAELG